MSRIQIVEISGHAISRIVAPPVIPTTSLDSYNHQCIIWDLESRDQRKDGNSLRSPQIPGAYETHRQDGSSCGYPRSMHNTNMVIINA